MAGDWIKFEAATPDKPEVWSIASQLGIDPDAVVGKLLRVWLWFDQHTTDGNAPSVTTALLDRCVGVTGFCKAVTQAGWMLDDGVTISLPNFDAHNGETAKKRCQTAKRVAKHKKSNAKVTQVALPDALPREDTREDITTTTTPNNHTAKVLPLAPVDQVTRSTIDLDWFPSQAFIDQLPFTELPPNTDWQSQVGEFVLYWRGRPEEKQTQSGWEHKFLSRLIHQHCRREEKLQ